MRISELFNRGRGPIFSFEFFPPKTDDGRESLLSTITDLSELDPGFVSVTYGAGGSARESTLELVSHINNQMHIETMAHLTCVGASRAEITAVLDRLEAAGIENLIALRGDPPSGKSDFVPHPDGMAHASDLVRMIRQQNRGFCVAAAAYPEGHVESASITADIDHLVEKVDEGVDVLITQLFFDNRFYFEFVDSLRRAGVTIPIVPGLMPITNVAQIERFTKMCGATIPAKLVELLDPVRDNHEAVSEIGTAYALDQCVELVRGGAPGIHFYTLNRSRSTARVLGALRDLSLW